MTTFEHGTILGYPRIGAHRELKKALEAFWRGKIDVVEFEQRSAEVRTATRRRLVELGLPADDASIPLDGALYDHVLDTLLTVGALPDRFADLESPERLSPQAEFVLARGDASHPPLEMTKWLNTNYHYLVPEYSARTTFAPRTERLERLVAEAQSEGVQPRPALVGPVSLLLLGKRDDGDALDLLPALVPVYARILERLAAAGVHWVQIDESALVSESLTSGRDGLAAIVAATYRTLAEVAERPRILVAAANHELGEFFEPLAASGIDGVAIDLVDGSLPTATDATRNVTLLAGVVDGRNIWRGDLEAQLTSLETAREQFPNVVVSTSASLQHVPHTTAVEDELDSTLLSWLAFADEKVTEVVTLARGLSEGRAVVQTTIEAASESLRQRASALGVREAHVRARTDALTDAHYERGSFEARTSAQDERLHLPAFPTTTIGSFPQTPEIRQDRARWARGEATDAEYEDAMRAEVRRVIELQDELGLDVLVHGEPERNDMVQYFAELLDGFDVTKYGWVQSYGSRATRPSILWGDVSRPAPMTVKWAEYAQSLTEKPVKGMLTGPVTILAWSFVRNDQPLGETARQVALALRDEIEDLESAGIAIVQVDEPALRELLPLKVRDHAAYLDWSVGSFKLSTAGAHNSTQVHTHLCYSEFGEIIDAIDGLDADVTSIEAARSRMEVVHDVAHHGFSRGIGPGVWDIHSPRVPSEGEISDLLATATTSIERSQLWVNPDCGLKTRGYDETIASLRNLVAATREARAALEAHQR